MKAGIIGLPKTGKTTIFNALTQGEQNTDKYAPPSLTANIGVVQVADERIDKLSELYKPKKTIYATIEYHDYPGIFYKESETSETALLSDIKNAEAFILVLRGFRDEGLEGLYPLDTPIEQFQHFQEEMLLYDLIMAEKRLEKIKLGYKRGVKTPAVQIEEKALHKIVDCLQI